MLVHSVATLAIVTSYTLSLQVARSVVSPTSLNFDRPVFIVAYTTSFNLLMCVPLFVRSQCSRERSSGYESLASSNTGDASFPSVEITFVLSVLWFLANWSYTLALKGLSAGIVSAVFSSNVAFAFIGEIAFGLRECLIKQAVAVCLAVAGVLVIMLASPSSSPTSVAPASNGTHQEDTSAASIGAALRATLAAAAAAAYKLAFKKLMPSSSAESVAALLVSIGSFHGLIFVLVAMTEERPIPWIALSVHATASLFYNFSINWGLGVLSPTFVSIALAAAIPLNEIIDFTRHETDYTLATLIGTILLVLAFLLMTSGLSGKETRDQGCHREEEEEEQEGKQIL